MGMNTAKCAKALTSHPIQERRHMTRRELSGNEERQVEDKRGRVVDREVVKAASHEVAAMVARKAAERAWVAGMGVESNRRAWPESKATDCASSKEV